MDVISGTTGWGGGNGGSGGGGSLALTGFTARFPLTLGLGWFMHMSPTPAKAKIVQPNAIKAPHGHQKLPGASVGSGVAFTCGSAVVMIVVVGVGTCPGSVGSLQ